LLESARLSRASQACCTLGRTGAVSGACFSAAIETTHIDVSKITAIAGLRSERFMFLLK
jgi:hypothetical protein